MKEQSLKQITKIAKALSDENRIRIICLLKHKKDLCVCEITEIIGLAQSTISSHLKLLENAGLIDSHKNGLWVNYNVSNTLDSFGADFIETFHKNLENDKQISADKEKIKSINREIICKKRVC